jgi:hypothetical protein
MEMNPNFTLPPRASYIPRLYTTQLFSDEIINQSNGLITRAVLERLYDPYTGTLDTEGLKNWIERRARFCPIKFPTDSDGEIDFTNWRKEPTTRDFSNFRFPLVELTAQEEQSLIKRFQYKFQTPRGIVYVPSRLINFIQEEHLYRDDENDKCQGIRYTLWGNQHIRDERYNFYQYLLHHDIDYCRISEEISSIGKPIHLVTQPTFKARILEKWPFPFISRANLPLYTVIFPLLDPLNRMPHQILRDYTVKQLHDKKKQINRIVNNFFKEFLFFINIMRITYIMTHITIRQTFNFKKNN